VTHAHQSPGSVQMTAFFKRLCRDKRGNALLIAGAAMPFVVGAAGLASDTIQWTLWKRQLQRAADSAAFAGVYASAASYSVPDAITADLNNNNQTKNQSNVSLLTGYPVITYPTSVNYTHGVRVQLAVQQKLGFSSLFLAAAPTITVSATAGLVDQGEYCAGGLMESGGPAITIGGSSSTNLGCNAYSASNSSPAVATNGSSYSFTAPEMSAVGGLPSAITGVATLKPYHMVMPDPFKDKYPTNIPSDATCYNNLNNGNVKYNKVVGGVTQTWIKSYETGKVCFTGNNGFKFTGGTYYLDPGTYYLDSTNFDTTGGTTLIGTGVTIILTGTTPGSIATNGNSTIQLSAPTSGTYSKMLFIQSSNATTNNGNTINGNNSSSFDGAMYLPKGQVTFSGSSGATTKCVMVIGYTLNFTGNTNLQNTTTGCTANTTFTGKAIKLFG